MSGSGGRQGGGAAPDGAVDGISEALARLIRDLGPGERLPGERELATRLGVSRTALRDRLRLLEALGVLRRQTGAGTFVQALNPSGVAQALNLGISASELPLEALHSVRVALERQAAMEAARAGNPVLIAHMRKAVDVISDAPDDAAVDEADFRFHDALLRAAGNPALSFFADALAGVLHVALAGRRAEMRRHLGDHEVMVHVHQIVYDAVASGDAATAARAVDEHFTTFDRLAAATAGAGVDPGPRRLPGGTAAPRLPSSPGDSPSPRSAGPELFASATTPDRG